jgi:hypothetical protein
MPIPTMHQPTPTSTRARYHAAPQGGAAVGGGQRLPPPRASPAPSTRQRNLTQLTSFCPAPPGHLGKPANESGMQGWQLATPQSYALLRMFAYATLLCTHAVYCLQHPCRPSSSCCTSAVWACVCVFGVCVYVSSVALVEVNEYTAFPRTVNAVAITAFHVVRDARIVGMPAVADKRTAVTVHGKVMKNIGHRLPSANNVVLHPGNNRTRHPCLVLFISGICGINSRIQSR